jgi:hypothetical protein
MQNRWGLGAREEGKSLMRYGKKSFRIWGREFLKTCGMKPIGAQKEI